MRLIGLLLLGGCIKAEPVVAAAEAVPVAVGSVVASVDGPTVAAPEAVIRALTEQLALRNLPPTVIDVVGGPTTTARLGLLAGTAPVALLVESTARFSSQINGRYRWTIDVVATLAPSDRAATRVERFTVAVALVYSHEREEAALAEAAPQIARRVGILLDDLALTAR